MTEPLELDGAYGEGGGQVLRTHLLTNAHVIQQFLPVAIQITGREGQPGRITVLSARP